MLIGSVNELGGRCRFVPRKGFRSMSEWAGKILVWIDRKIGKFAIVRALAKWRLRGGYCPQCNSDAPAIDTCMVCKNGTLTTEFPPGPLERVLMWELWLKANSSYRFSHEDHGEK